MWLFENFAVDFILLLVTIYIAIRLYYSHCYKYWERLGVPYIKPKFPLGNSLEFFTKYFMVGSVSIDFYKQVRELGLKYAGIYLGTTPNLVVADPDVIKDILVKDFDHFVDRGMYMAKKDPLSTHLFNFDAADWRPMRVKLTPTFTSGKIKSMFNLMLQVSNHMTDYLKSKSEFDAKDVMRRFTIDVIGICAFAINCNSFKDTDAEFVHMSKEIFNPSFYQKFKILLALNFTKLCKKYSITITKPSVRKFFMRITDEAVKSREQSKIERGDFIQILLEIKNKLGEENFNLHNMTSQTFLFFVAGFDTSSTALSFSLYLLAKNPEIQEKLREEIIDVLSKYNDEITYDNINEMKYLQMVVDETLRLYPSLPAINRRCTKDYIIPGTNHLVENGVPIIISAMGLHRDPEYWDEPEKFDPERFTEENKSKRHPYVHLPFGAGPRNCIGLRFGLLQTKLGIIQVLRNFKVSPCPRTEEPIIDKSFLLATTNPMYLKIEKI